MESVQLTVCTYYNNNRTAKTIVKHTILFYILSTSRNGRYTLIKVNRSGHFIDKHYNIYIIITVMVYCIRCMPITHKVTCVLGI